MSRKLEPLLRGAVTLVMASSAVVSGCGDEVAPGIEGDAGFVSVSCKDPLGDLLRGLTPEPAVDYLELRLFGPIDSGGIAASVGEACATAQDKETCQAQLKAATVTRGFQLDPCLQICQQYYLVATQGDDVALLGSSDRVTAMLGTIDTPEEATLLVRMEGFDAPCGSGGAKPNGSGFTVQAFSYEGCNGKTRHLFNVSRAGVVTPGESAVLEKADPNCVVGRRPTGLARPRRRCDAQPSARYLADAARLEAASVHAFRQVATELRLHGAPRRLIAAAHRAAADEVRHARMTAGLARRFGARRLEPPQIAPSAPRDLEAMLLENAVEGCVRETFGAAVGIWQAKHAGDPKVAKAMRRIAADELKHASLAWKIAAWSERKLSASALARIRDARRAAAAGLRSELEQPPHTSIIAALGVPSAENALRLHRALERRVWL
jgi:hypothetical protein